MARYWQSVGYEEVTVGLLGWAEVLVPVDTEVGVTAGHCSAHHMAANIVMGSSLELQFTSW